MEHNEPHKQNNMKDAILGAIKTKRLSMRSKYYFWLRIAALLLVSAAAFFVSTFIFNFILFSIRINSQDTFLSFGPRGWGAFFYFFPWHLFALDVVLVGALLWLLRQFKFGYKSPMLYVLLFLVATTVTLGTLIDRGTGLNDKFLRDADERRLPRPINDVYGRVRHMPPPGSGFCKGCTVVSINGNTLIVADPRASTTPITVMLPPNDPRATTSNLEAGDVIFVAGDKQGDFIQAFGVREMGSLQRVK